MSHNVKNHTFVIYLFNMQYSYIPEIWVIKNLKPSEEINIQKLNINPLTLKVLINRGVGTNKEIEEFLDPQISNLNSPILLPNLIKGANILQNAIKNKKKIRIVGDYDADGITSTYILTDSIRKLDGIVDYRIPKRVSEGYGISEEIVDECIEEDVDVIITCDNGIAAFAPIKKAVDAKIEVVVTDHHEVVIGEDGEEILPEADAVINPKMGSSKYPFPNICGAGVAFKLCEYLWMIHGKDLEEFYGNYLGPLAIGTICDVMPLISENRTIVVNGINKIIGWENVGFKALFTALGLKYPITNYHIGFIIGPTLNSSGRFEDAKIALDLLFEEDEEKAKALAEHLVSINTERKDHSEEGFIRGVEMVEKYNLLSKVKVLVLYIKDIHESICGIVAGKIKEKYNRPTIVVTNTTNGLKGSGRSIENYDMFEKISKSKEYLNTFGGHKMACGLSLSEDNLRDFIFSVEKNSDLTFDDLKRKITLDGALNFKDITMDRVLDLKKLEPFGNFNPSPLFGTLNVVLQGIKILGKNRNFIKMYLSQGGVNLEGTMFEPEAQFLEKMSHTFGEDAVRKALAGRGDILMDVCYSLAINEFRGETTLQLRLKSYRKAGD